MWWISSIPIRFPSPLPRNPNQKLWILDLHDRNEGPTTVPPNTVFTHQRYLPFQLNKLFFLWIEQRVIIRASTHSTISSSPTRGPSTIFALDLPQWWRSSPVHKTSYTHSVELARTAARPWTTTNLWHFPPGRSLIAVDIHSTLLHKTTTNQPPTFLLDSLHSQSQCCDWSSRWQLNRNESYIGTTVDR